MVNRISWQPRILAVFMVAAVIFLFPPKFVDLIAFATLLAHYVAAFWFHPWRKIRGKGVLWPHVLLILISFVVAELQFAFVFPHIVIFFGLHFILTEIYDGRTDEALFHRWARGVYYFVVYFFYMRFHLGLGQYETGFFLLGAAALAVLLAARPSVEVMAYELSFLIPVVAAVFMPTRFSQILLYHVMAWWMIPVVRGYAKEQRRYYRDCGLLAAVFLIVVLGTYLHDDSLYSFWNREVTRLGYFHIMSSFVMSNLNPALIRENSLRIQAWIGSGFGGRENVA